MKMVVCGLCDEIWVIWNALDVRNYVYENDKELWNHLSFVCIKCSDADPTNPPSPYSQPISPTKTTAIPQAVMMDNDDCDDGKDDEKKIKSSRLSISISISRNTNTTSQTIKRWRYCDML